MRSFRTVWLGAAASVAMLTATATAFAQSGPAPRTRLIQVPQGAVVLVLQPGQMQTVPFTGGPAFDAAFPVPAMPDPVTMIRQMDARMDQMMAETRAAFGAQDRLIEAAMNGTPVAGPGVRGVVVTSFSDGHGTCTRRVVYGGDGGAPKVEVSSTGDASCVSAGAMPGATTPAAAPSFGPRPQPPAPAAPSPTRTWRVDNRVQPAGTRPMMVAQLGD
jgi:hypothetical protein